MSSVNITYRDQSIDSVILEEGTLLIGSNIFSSYIKLTNVTMSKYEGVVE